MSSTPSQPNTASAAGVLLTAITVVFVYVQNRILAQREYTTVRGKGFRPKLIPLGRWGLAGLAFAASDLVLAVVLPWLVLLESALRSNPYVARARDLVDPAALGLRAVRATLVDPTFHLALRNSLVTGFGAALIGGAFHLLLSYVANRTALTGRKSLEYLAMVPAAVPGMVLGLGLLWTWINLPMGIYGSLWVLVLAFIARFLPQGYRSVTATIMQVDKDLEDSAYVSGASRLRAVTAITIPLIRSGIVATAMLLLILSMRELSTVIMLYTTRTTVLSVLLWETWERGQWPQSATIALAYCFLLTAITLVGRRWLGAAGGE